MDEMDGMSRADRLRSLWREDSGRAGIDAYKRRAQLEQEFARERPDEPIREGTREARK